MVFITQMRCEGSIRQRGRVEGGWLPLGDAGDSGTAP